MKGNASMFSHFSVQHFYLHRRKRRNSVNGIASYFISLELQLTLYIWAPIYPPRRNYKFILRLNVLHFFTPRYIVYTLLPPKSLPPTASEKQLFTQAHVAQCIRIPSALSDKLPQTTFRRWWGVILLVFIMRTISATQTKPTERTTLPMQLQKWQTASYALEANEMDTVWSLAATVQSTIAPFTSSSLTDSLFLTLRFKIAIVEYVPHTNT